MTGYAVIHPGLEQVVVTDLASAGVAGQAVPGGVRFACDAAEIARLARVLRTPSQLLLELGHGQARTPDQLSALVRKLPWRSWLHPQAQVHAEVNARGSALRFKEAAARNVTTAIREALKGPFVPDRTLRPKVTQRVQVRIVDDFVTISLDASGDLLHKRGWRVEAGKAPIRENLAACLLSLAGWTGQEALVDPFCGSGTIPIEAAFLSLGRSPFGRRLFACDEWVFPAAKGKKRPIVGQRPGAPVPRGGPTRPEKRTLAPVSVPIVGSDHHGATIVSAQANARRAGLDLSFSTRDVVDLVPPTDHGTIVANPPYGERLGERVGGVYVHFGRVLRERFGGWRVLFITTTPELANLVDRRVSRVAHFKNGGIQVGAYFLDL